MRDSTETAFMDPRNEATRPLPVCRLRKEAALDIISREYDGVGQFGRDGAIVLDEKRHHLIAMCSCCKCCEAEVAFQGSNGSDFSTCWSVVVIDRQQGGKAQWLGDL